ncbi:hypothetical protein [Burkholderia vietnamiensis]|uniref:hypothetical protein n=1 Tax=Burkholderia vietnamiensis TaxID=60552 RepID=UPI0012D8E273|nr:hypothetical protein [Burkholderia vietnamiensis]
MMPLNVAIHPIFRGDVQPNRDAASPQCSAVVASDPSLMAWIASLAEARRMTCVKVDRHAGAKIDVPACRSRCASACRVPSSHARRRGGMDRARVARECAESPDDFAFRRRTHRCSYPMRTRAGGRELRLRVATGIDRCCAELLTGEST